MHSLRESCIALSWKNFPGRADVSALEGGQVTAGRGPEDKNHVAGQRINQTGFSLRNRVILPRDGRGTLGRIIRGIAPTIAPPLAIEYSWRKLEPRASSTFRCGRWGRAQEGRKSRRRRRKCFDPQAETAGGVVQNQPERHPTTVRSPPHRAYPRSRCTSGRVR